MRGAEQKSGLLLDVRRRQCDDVLDDEWMCGGIVVADPAEAGTGCFGSPRRAGKMPGSPRTRGDLAILFYRTFIRGRIAHQNWFDQQRFCRDFDEFLCAQQNLYSPYIYFSHADNSWLRGTHTLGLRSVSHHGGAAFPVRVLQCAV